MPGPRMLFGGAPRLRISPKASPLAAAAIAAALAIALSGCSSGAGVGSIGSLSPGPIPYQPGNAIAPTGYSESQLGPDRYRIEVRGPVTSSRQRMEKIATTRAAEIGKENRLGFFKVENVAHNTHCENFTPGPRSPGAVSGTKKLAYAVTTADVSYTKTPPDQTYLNARTSFDQLRAELDQDAASPAPPADPAALAQCS